MTKSGAGALVADIDAPLPGGNRRTDFRRRVFASCSTRIHDALADLLSLWKETAHRFCVPSANQ